MFSGGGSVINQWLVQGIKPALPPLSVQMHVLASDVPRGSEFGKAEPIGLVIIVVMLIATLFLILRSMNSHIRKLPATFGPESQQSLSDTDADSGDPASPRMSYWEYRMRKRIAEFDREQKQRQQFDSALGIPRPSKSGTPLDKDPL